MSDPMGLRGHPQNLRRVEVLRGGIDLDIAEGEFTGLRRPSGCGKVHAAAHDRRAGDIIDDGEVAIAGTRVNEIAPAERDIAMVFQSYAPSIPHMTVARTWVSR